MTTEQRLPISVCIIAGNEARRIRRALESVAGWAGEIIVVLNDDVNDGTDKIAETFGAKIFREPWKGHVAQKNSADAKAAHPWILGLDADEEVSPALRDEIRQAVAGPGANAAFCFPRCSFYCGRWIRHGDWYPDRKVRLWRRDAGQWEGDPHEKLVLQGPVISLRSNLLHYSNESIDQFVGKMEYISTVFVRQCQAQGRRVRWTDLAVRPFWKFFRAYVIRLGFLDGWPGYLIAWANALSTVVRYTKVKEAELPKINPQTKAVAGSQPGKI